MAEIQGQVAVADVDGDGHLDMCAVDFKSNIACFTRDGEDLWDRQISGVAAQVLWHLPPPRSSGDAAAQGAGGAGNASAWAVIQPQTSTWGSV